jgi:hypothetical protein
MHSIVTIAVIIALTISRSVHCLQKALVTFDITYHMLEEQLGEQRAPRFLYELCQQSPDRDGNVRGAIKLANERKNIAFMLWGQYMERSAGNLGPRANNFAFKSWDTFKVKCGFVASSTWANNVPVQSSLWVRNETPRDSMYEVPISITISPFRCDSSISSWTALSRTPLPGLDAPSFLSHLSGLPNYHQDQWIGTQFSTAAIYEYRPQLEIQGYHKALLSASMVERTVEAYLAIEVVGYFFGKGGRISAPTWRGMEGWNRIYTKNAGTIQCTAMCNFMPDHWVTVNPWQEPL